MVFISSLFGMRHLSIRMDPVIACNLRCRMCYFSDDDYRKNKKKGVLSDKQLEVISKYLFPRAAQVVIGCGAEPTLYPGYEEIIARAKSCHVPYVSLVTNGQLLSEDSITRLVKNGLDEIILSVHGATKKSYEYWMQNASFDRLIESLMLINKIKNELDKENPLIRINFTANPENFEDIGKIIPVFQQYHLDTVQVRPAMDIGGSYHQSFDNDIGEQYRRMIELIKKQALHYGITLLANVNDVNYSGKPKNSKFIETIYKYVSPSQLADSEWQWEKESYNQFRLRTKWHWNLLKSVFEKKNNQKQRLLDNASRYDVFN